MSTRLPMGRSVSGVLFDVLVINHFNFPSGKSLVKGMGYHVYRRIGSAVYAVFRVAFPFLPFLGL